MTTRTQLRALVGESTMRTAAEQLLHATRGCRPDMHEPDEQGLRAQVRGRHFDNAGTDGELVVEFVGEEAAACHRVTRVNLATLTALARVGAAALLEAQP